MATAVAETAAANGAAGGAYTPLCALGAGLAHTLLAGAEAGEAVAETWHDALLGYMGGDRARRGRGLDAAPRRGGARAA